MGTVGCITVRECPFDSCRGEWGVSQLGCTLLVVGEGGLYHMCKVIAVIEVKCSTGTLFVLNYYISQLGDVTSKFKHYIES